ncbi:hypothetical protein Glove_352g61 [Diversispora epigaea]|uniref:Calmodulin-lysine N-methyltransferase n=1 Tax=Diversispora epigaea TaxID=1348612 RepID=A0A397HC74_9GLOM|nr:hypothetical protein Glove_352g61 [Diversispora epigaea]
MFNMSSTTSIFNNNNNRNPSTIAKARWKLLSSIFISNNISNDISSPSSSLTSSSLTSPSSSLQFTNSQISKRSHQGFNLFPKQKFDNNEEWFKYDLKDGFYLDVCIKIPQIQTLKDSFSSEYSGFLNTGNICIWPAEEVLAYYCMKNSELFSNKSICEIGGGMCSLAGLIIAAKCNPKNVTLTDGNPNLLFSNVDISIKQMLWDSNTAYNDTYDVVICADCTFDKSTHPHLLHVLKSIIKKPLPGNNNNNNSNDNNNNNYYSGEGGGGLFILCAPNRGDSLNAFIKLIESLEKDLKIELLIKYDDIVWNIHENNLNNNNNNMDNECYSYDPDTHYPLILKVYWRY